MSLTLRLIDLIGNTQINKWYGIVKHSQFWSESEIKSYQEEKLKLLIKHAFNNVPYYRNLFRDLNLTPEDIRTKDDLLKLPVLTRRILRDHNNKLKNDNHSNFNSQKRRTGGTTGEPVSYMSDRNSWSLHWALKYRAWEWGGYRIGDKVGVMGGASVIPENKASLRRKVWNSLNRLYPMPTSHMTDEVLARFAAEIHSERIKCLRGYPSSISAFARYCRINKIDLDINTIITTAEVLQPVYKEEIQQAFKPVIIDSYGCADGGGNGNTCLHDCGFHVSMESAIWEVCTPDGQPVKENELGEVTLTSLTNYAMPLIRYQPGDVVENSFDYSKCACGCTLPRIKSILGRTTDILHFSNGLSLGGPAFTLIFRNFPLIKWQMVQNDNVSVDLNIIPTQDFNQGHVYEILRLLTHHCGKGVEIRIHEVSEIKDPPNGKHRIIINNTRN